MTTIEDAASNTKNNLSLLLERAVAADDFKAATNLLAALQALKEAQASLQVSADPEFLRWGLNGNERTLVKGGEYIPAMKAVRSRTGLGLKEAKDMCDAYRAHSQRTP